MAATAPALTKPRLRWHDTASWSVAEDRIPSAVWLGILWIGIIAGFGVDIPSFTREQPAARPVVYVHGAVFVIWLLLVTMQVLLVVRNQARWHRRLGWWVASWALLMVALGPWAAFSSQGARYHTAQSDPAFLSVQLLGVAAFVVLLAWGLRLRKNPAAHRRMMILATVALCNAGFARVTLDLLPVKAHNALEMFALLYYGDVLVIGLMAAWDAWRGRLMRTFVLGAAALIAAEVTATFLYFWPPWQALTSAWVGWFVRL